jgi:hypothetical protein
MDPTDIRTGIAIFVISSPTHAENGRYGTLFASVKAESNVLTQHIMEPVEINRESLRAEMKIEHPSRTERKMRQGCKLTKEEVETIIRLLAKTDMTNAEIAERMRCTPGAVAAINRKYQTRNYAGLRKSWEVVLVDSSEMMPSKRSA